MWRPELFEEDCLAWREYCKCDDCGKTSWREALEKAQYVRLVPLAMILG